MGCHVQRESEKARGGYSAAGVTVAYTQVDVANGLEQVDRGADDVGGKRLFCCMGKEAGGG